MTNENIVSATNSESAEDIELAAMLAADEEERNVREATLVEETEEILETDNAFPEEIEDVETGKVATPLETQIFGNFMTVPDVLEIVGPEFMWEMATAVATPLELFIAEQDEKIKKLEAELAAALASPKKEHAGSSKRAMNDDQVREVRDLYGKPRAAGGKWSYNNLATQLLIRDGVNITPDAVRSCIMRETYRNVK